MSNEGNNKQEEKKQGSNKITIGIILALIVLIILLLLRGCGLGPTGGEGNGKPVFDLTQDSNVAYGDRETMTTEEIQAELNKQVADGMINISMNLNPIFANGGADGNLLIVNEKINKHPQVIEIYRKGTEELLYKSGAIPVGGRVDYGKLLVDLDAGEYDCIAYFNSINENTGELLGKAGAEVKITVEG